MGKKDYGGKRPMGDEVRTIHYMVVLPVAIFPWETSDSFNPESYIIRAFSDFKAFLYILIGAKAANQNK